MGLFSFIKEKGAKIFGKKEAEAPAEEKKTLQAQALLDYVKELGLPYNRLKLSVTDDDVKVEGEVASQEDAEKIVLAIGNVEGVDKVDNLMIVMLPAMEANFYTVVSGDTLSKISKEFYGDANKYNTIFEANKPMLSHPDKIYPGQVLRIPNL
ncbi:peptidoglycan-binding protein LysM [Flavobacterium sp. CBA20B-1]|uniref:peptidoglycan-binding protein LysM n=1 Tax=unclassified Flavobacterium TaxID=196869 RepID=UPI0022245581|nr:MULTISPECIES: peptidoglycan-binding protein LysM [unclassified Flavobacterium]WCM43290.1 peptidoglycan-binding protein LysM [Flavobacterium sp. CBA20B-1]